MRHASWRGLRTDRFAASARRVPEPIPPPAQGTVIGAMQTPDGRWRVEAVRRGKQDFYRLIHGDNVVDGLFIASVQRLLTEAGVDMADLVGADTASSASSITVRPYAAGAARCPLTAPLPVAQRCHPLTCTGRPYSGCRLRSRSQDARW
jgi:hypothetical protein